ncbi:MAG TPA: hypothetical protein DCM45_00720, partial [Clostridiales bacterium]|nr:hypothetical protein [Clostridiales bacterium]
IVSRRETGKDYLKIAGVLLLALLVLILISIFGNYVGFLLPLLLVGVGYGLYMLITGMNIEYEYIVTNGDLDIDQIVARRKRKRIFSCKSKEIELMAKVGGDEWRDAQKQTGRKLLDCSAAVAADGNWFILSEYKGQRLLVVFAPDDRMLKSMRRYNPSKIKYVQYGA